jgi:hypothetical protein
MGGGERQSANLQVQAVTQQVLLVFQKLWHCPSEVAVRRLQATVAKGVVDASLLRVLHIAPPLADAAINPLRSRR